MSTEVHQNEYWSNFYESAWKMRHSSLQDFVEKEGLNPYQAIEKLEGIERRHHCLKTPFGVMFQKIDFKMPLEQLLPTGAPPIKMIQILEATVPSSFYAGPVDLILDWLSMNPVKAIVELGAGFGQNLIKMYHRYGPLGAKVYAGEYTQSGRELAEFLFRSLPELSSKVFPFDHKAPDLSVVEERDDILIISCHSIEQVTKIPHDYFEQLTKGKTKVHGLFFEPFGFQISSGGSAIGDVSKRHQESAQERGWNLNFAEVLVGAQNIGTIRIEKVFKNLMPGDFNNPTSFVYWRKA